jgi:hypothetical protein
MEGKKYNKKRSIKTNGIDEEGENVSFWCLRCERVTAGLPF